ncbi:MAG: sigma-70 family RNA polymerase sigma factor [Planctomycetes bacterium]|nr:sigma-70 family RNA polymerase sigma factor [Planctomycetota bacterium]
MDSVLEARLIERASGGDAAARDELFRAHLPRLTRMVELRLDPSLRRRLDPADVVQDAWLEASRRFAEWRAQTALPFHVWLRLLTGQALLTVHRRHLGAHKRDALRERHLASGGPGVSATNVAEWFAASATSPSQAVLRSEVRARVLTALEELEELDREILSLRHFEGLTNEEAAAELAIEPAAASKRFVRALVRLRPALSALAP